MLLPIIIPHGFFFLICSNCFQTIPCQVKNLRFAPPVISLRKIRLKLDVFFIIWAINENYYIFLSVKREKDRIWKDFFWIMGKILGKLSKCHYWALDSKWTLDNIGLATEHSNDILNSLVSFSFTCWQLKISRNLQKNVIKEANWVGGPLLMTHPVRQGFN